jgi:hypothetical protein
MTEQEAIAERDYIASINPLAPGATFNHCPKVFAQYCNMQANDARNICPPAAADMVQARDIAWPNFRALVHRLGGYVEDGIFVPYQPAVDKL